MLSDEEIKTKVVVFRHAQPQSGGFATSDLAPISEEGRKIQTKVAQEVQKSGLIPNVILSSPLLRAVQTAEVIAEVLQIEEILEEPALGNDFDANKLLNRLEKGKTTFLVGHAPSLSEFVNALTGEVVLPKGLSKSSAAVIEFNGEVTFGRGKLTQYFKPNLGLKPT